MSGSQVPPGLPTSATVAASLRTFTLPTHPDADWPSLSHWPSKDPVDDLEYRVDAREWLADAGLTLDGISESHSLGLTVKSIQHSDGLIKVRITDGTPKTTATIRLLLALSEGEDLAVTMSLPIRAAAPGGLVSMPTNGAPNTIDATATLDSDAITIDAG